MVPTDVSKFRSNGADWTADNLLVLGGRTLCVYDTGAKEIITSSESCYGISQLRVLPPAPGTDDRVVVVSMLMTGACVVDLRSDTVLATYTYKNTNTKTATATGHSRACNVLVGTYNGVIGVHNYVAASNEESSTGGEGAVTKKASFKRSPKKKGKSKAATTADDTEPQTARETVADTEEVHDVVFSPDGTLAATMGTQNIRGEYSSR